MTEEQISKRQLLKKAAYIAPTILTLQALPSFASNGSGPTEEQGSGFAEREPEEYKEKSNNGVGKGGDKHQEKSKKKG